MQLASLSVLEDKQVQRSFFGTSSHIINPLLTKLVRSRWLDIGLILFFAQKQTNKQTKNLANIQPS